MGCTSFIIVNYYMKAKRILFMINQVIPYIELVIKKEKKLLNFFCLMIGDRFILFLTPEVMGHRVNISSNLINFFHCSDIPVKLLPLLLKIIPRNFP